MVELKRAINPGAVGSYSHWLVYNIETGAVVESWAHPSAAQFAAKVCNRWSRKCGGRAKYKIIDGSREDVTVVP